MKNKLPKRLVQLQNEKGYKSTREAAIALDIPYHTYWAYVKGERSPQLDALIDIAQFYGVSVDYLLGLINKKDEQEGKIISIDELKEHFPELSDKLDEVGARFLRWSVGKMEDDDILQLIHDALEYKKNNPK